MPYAVWHCRSGVSNYAQCQVPPLQHVGVAVSVLPDSNLHSHSFHEAPDADRQDHYTRNM